MRRIVLLSVAVAVLAFPAFAQLNLQLRWPDVAVTTSAAPPPVSGKVNVTWKVSNAGQANSPATTLRLTCKQIYAQKALSGCLFNLETVSIPPIMAGDSFDVVRQAAYISPTIDANTGKQYLYRFELEASIDPTGSMTESSEANNKSVAMLENFTGAPPALPGFVFSTSMPRLPAPETTMTISATSNEPVITPVLEVYTATQPWNPAAKTWIMYKNKGTVDSPPVQVQRTCVGHRLEPDTQETYDVQCPAGTFVYLSGSGAMPSLKPGEFKAIGEFLILPTSNGLWGEMLETRATFTLYTGASPLSVNQLVLSTETK